MKRYEFNYKKGYYEINTGPGFNPLWIALALGIILTVLAINYN
jgi:hypothetical protein